MTSAEAGLEGKSQNERDSFQGTLEECRRLLLRVFEGISHTLKGRSTRCGFRTAAGISHHVYLLGNSDFFYAISQDFAPIFFGVPFLTKSHRPLGHSQTPLSVSGLCLEIKVSTSFILVRRPG